MFRTRQKSATFRRLTAGLLASCVLALSLVWSWDVHAQAFTGHTDEVMAAAQDGLDSTGTHQDADHCCHALAHLLALTEQGFAVHPAVRPALRGQPSAALPTGAWPPQPRPPSA